jgi:hypothetical protein
MRLGAAGLLSSAGVLSVSVVSSGKTPFDARRFNYFIQLFNFLEFFLHQAIFSRKKFWKDIVLKCIEMDIDQLPFSRMNTRNDDGRRRGLPPRAGLSGIR